MSTKLLNLYTNATLPQNFTGLDRHLLEHYCNRQIDDLGKAFPGMPELVRIFNCDSKSLIRSRRRLIKAGALIPITRGFPGQCSEFAVNEKFLLDHQQVTDELPITRNRLPSKPRQVTLKAVTGNSMDTDRSPTSNPIQENNKTIKQQEVSDYWYQLIELIPGNKRFAHTPTILELLSTLKHKGTSFKVIRDAIETIPWGLVNNPSGWITKLLRDLETRPPVYDMENKPTWCGKCDEPTRRLNEPVAIPNGNGSITLDCITCHPTWVNKRLGN
jgi:hypothetical protein